MLKRRLDGKTFGMLLLILVSVCVSTSAQQRSESWAVNPFDYRYDMSLYFGLSSADNENLDRYEIGAFVEDECRGVAEKFELPDNGSCMYMRIRSNSAQGEEVVFKMRDKETGETVLLKGNDGSPFFFKADQMVGMPSEPYALIRYFNVTVTAGENGSVSFENGMYAEGTILNLTAVPSEGYHFEVWSDGNKDAERSITVENDVELSASFAVNTYKAIFKIDDEAIATLDVDFGTSIDVPDAPVREGYTFAGWSDVPETMPAHDIEIIGSYTVNTYRLTVYLNDEIYLDEELDFGAEVVIPAPEVPADMEFKGWDEEIPATMPAHDVVVHGTMTEKVDVAIGIVFGEETLLTIYNTNGILLHKDIRAGDVKDGLVPGFYIINGQKVLVR